MNSESWDKIFFWCYGTTISISIIIWNIIRHFMRNNNKIIQKYIQLCQEIQQMYEQDVKAIPLSITRLIPSTYYKRRFAWTTMKSEWKNTRSCYSRPGVVKPNDLAGHNFVSHIKLYIPKNRSTFFGVQKHIELLLLCKYRYYSNNETKLNLIIFWIHNCKIIKQAIGISIIYSHKNIILK